MIQVTGILVNPFNEPVKTTIRISAVLSEVTFIGGEAIVEVGEDGVYDFNLVEGTFNIELIVTDEYTQPVLVLINSSTSAVISLPELLVDYVV